jgi:hypothetical protein
MGNHKSPTLCTTSAFSCNSIVKGLHENCKEVISILVFGNSCLGSYSIPYL